MKAKYLFATTKGVSEDGSFEAVASTAALDRDNEVIDPAAWEASLTTYRTNPVLLATHLHRTADGRSPVIGSAPEIAVVEGQLRFRGRFAGTALGQEYGQLYREGHMRAFSVGFAPKKGDWQDRGGTGRKIFVHTEVELLEISAVPVPANPEALARMIAAAAGIDLDGEPTLSSIVTEEEGPLDRRIAALEAKIEDLRVLVVDQFDQLKAFWPETAEAAGQDAGPRVPPAHAPDGGKGAGTQPAEPDAEEAARAALLEALAKRVKGPLSGP